VGGGIPLISAATATANVSNGAVTSIDVTYMGTGYTSTPTVEIGPPTTLDASHVFNYNGNAQIIKTTNISSYTVTINGVEVPSAPFTTYYVTKGDTMAFVITKIDPYKESCLTLSMTLN